MSGTEVILNRDTAAALFGDDYPRPPFINLCELHCSQPSSWEGHGLPLPDHRLFLGAAMVNLSLNHYPIDEQAEQMLADIPRLCPNLQALRINYPIGALIGSPRAVPPLRRPGFFRSLTELSEISIGSPLPASAFEEMRSLPRLQSLSFVPALEDPWIPPPAPYPPFSSLTDLTIDGSSEVRKDAYYADRCANVLTMAYFPVLESLRILAAYIGSFEHINTLIEAHCSHTALRELHITREAAVVEADIDLDDVIAEDIRPLYAFRNMRAVTLNEAYNFQLTDDDVREMALAWPRLERLSLMPMYMVMEENGYFTVEGGVPPPETTLRALVHFARHCPELNELWIRVSTADTDAREIRRMMFAEGPLRFVPSLTRLRLGHCLPAGNPKEVLAALAAMFPRLHQFDVEVSEEVEEGSEAWTELGRLFGLKQRADGPTYYQVLVNALWNNGA